MGSGASNQVDSVSALDVSQEKSRGSTRAEETTVIKDNIPVQKSSSQSQRLSLSQDLIVNFKSQKEVKKVKQEQETEVISLTSTGNSVKSSQSQTTHTTLKNLSNEELHAKVKQLEKELAHCESQRLDLQDQVQALEERSKANPESNPHRTPEKDLSLNETVHAKDQYILKLEKDLLNTQAESNKMRVKLKKRIRVLNNQLHELRQEASISQFEMKAGTREKDKTNMNSISPGTGGNGMTDSNVATDSNHSKVIVELSNQLSEQSQQIATLQSEVNQKDLQILELEKLVNEKLNSQSTNNKFSKIEALKNNELPVSSDRLHSSRGKRYFNQGYDSHSDQQMATNLSGKERRNEMLSKSSQSKPTLERQSTALSDSDTDWDIDSVPSHIHSAPARTRVKSAVLTSGTTDSAGDGLARTRGEDDSIMDLANFKTENDSCSSRQRVRPQKKSALRNRLEQQKKHKEFNALMGPSLAFAAPYKDLPSDTSCEPTPRNSDPSKLPGFSKLKVVHPRVL